MLCPNCFFENPPNVRNCQQCGQLFLSVLTQDKLLPPSSASAGVNTVPIPHATKVLPNHPILYFWGCPCGALKNKGYHPLARQALICEVCQKPRQKEEGECLEEIHRAHKRIYHSDFLSCSVDPNCQFNKPPAYISPPGGPDSPILRRRYLETHRWACPSAHVNLGYDYEDQKTGKGLRCQYCNIAREQEKEWQCLNHKYQDQMYNSISLSQCGDPSCRVIQPSNQKPMQREQSCPACRQIYFSGHESFPCIRCGQVNPACCTCNQLYSPECRDSPCTRCSRLPWG
jgi:hypothetical protein